jgi:hypothetical protein
MVAMLDQSVEASMSTWMIFRWCSNCPASPRRRTDGVFLHATGDNSHLSARLLDKSVAGEAVGCLDNKGHHFRRFDQLWKPCLKSIVSQLGSQHGIAAEQRLLSGGDGY